MNVTNTPWRFPALLERREGIDQPVRGGSNADIRAGLAKLLGLEDTPTKEACTPTGCAVPVASEETGMDSPIANQMPNWDRLDTQSSDGGRLNDDDAGRPGTACRRLTTAAAAGTVTRAGGGRSTESGGPSPEKADAARTRTRQRTNQTPVSGHAAGLSRDDDGEGLGVMHLDGYQALTHHTACNSRLLPSTPPVPSPLGTVPPRRAPAAWWTWWRRDRQEAGR